MDIADTIDMLKTLTPADMVMIAACFLGVAFFINWLMGPAGPFDLSNIPTRRNKIPYFAPFVLMGCWILLIMACGKAAEAASEQWRQEFYTYIAIAAVELIMIMFFIGFARANFARGLKGFGLDIRTVRKDLPAAIINLITATPFVMAGVAMVFFFGRLFRGHEFEFAQSEGLTVILENPQIYLRVLMVVFIAIVAPVFEEMLFRGILQSMIQGFISRPWVSVLLTSIVFVVLHPSMHWPALFALSVCMGYSYEKSGSLFRPILIHAAFNGINLAAAMTGQV